MAFSGIWGKPSLGAPVVLNQTVFNAASCCLYQHWEEVQRDVLTLKFVWDDRHSRDSVTGIWCHFKTPQKKMFCINRNWKIMVQFCDSTTWVYQNWVWINRKFSHFRFQNELEQTMICFSFNNMLIPFSCK